MNKPCLMEVVIRRLQDVPVSWPSGQWGNHVRPNKHKGQATEQNTVVPQKTFSHSSVSAGRWVHHSSRRRRTAWFFSCSTSILKVPRSIFYRPVVRLWENLHVQLCPSDSWNKWLLWVDSFMKENRFDSIWNTALYKLEHYKRENVSSLCKKM